MGRGPGGALCVDVCVCVFSALVFLSNTLAAVLCCAVLRLSAHETITREEPGESRDSRGVAVVVVVVVNAKRIPDAELQTEVFKCRKAEQGDGDGAVAWTWTWTCRS